VDLSTGLSSQKTCERVEKQNEKSRKGSKKGDLTEQDFDEAINVAVSVRGSRVHGWGLFADQHFKAGAVVAEYVGEYVSFAVTEAREKMYQEQRIQDYQFRLDDQLVIDATMRGGHGRYINHNCNPNCIAKMIPGAPPNEHLKRVIIIAQRNIAPREELTYDYQFPLELDLDARIPCNCHSEHCRGFMNWDLPEKGSNNRVFRSQKRGANMRDRIRRLGRPLKSEK
jgi:histone-lysine N-methyltransferase SETD1